MMITQRAALLCSTSITSPQSIPAQPEHLLERMMIAHAYLGRQPIVISNPFTGAPFFIETEPDDWRDFIALAEQREGGVEGLTREMRRSAGRGSH
ncbi:hypothetical protein [Pseudogemmobacter sonorensis]|uniref:hypothetical protein n=1 Tax=Pseudogemmobacter sonorensis TaxID=2989681 RepID=UPI0036C62809